MVQQIVNLPIPQNGEIVEASYTLSSSITFVEHVDLKLTADHPLRGQLEVFFCFFWNFVEFFVFSFFGVCVVPLSLSFQVFLVSPAGTKSALQTEHGDRNPNINWRYGTV